MSNLRIVQGEVVTPEKVEIRDLFIEEGLIDFVPMRDEQNFAATIEAHNCYVTPGLFDLQVNGSAECDLWTEPDIKQFAGLCAAMLRAGVTAFLPTLITADIQHLYKNINFLESVGVGKNICQDLNQSIYQQLEVEPYAKKAPSQEIILLPGIHLEGPYLSKLRAGAHPPQFIKPIDMTELTQLMRPNVKLVTLAPELKNAELAIDYLLKHKIIPSLGHSNATYEQAERAFAAGIPIVTHIFNALPPIHQRQPGAVVAALLDENVYCCVICDGLHVDPEMVKLLIKVKGKERVILVTDIAHIGTTGGSLVGSSITLSEAVSNIVNWGIVSFSEAIQMASLNPARAMNLDKMIGQIEKGRRADLVIWDKKSFKVKHVIANGITIF
jgi:N-acetylglucosamine-6-phosphate deacetylase